MMMSEKAMALWETAARYYLRNNNIITQSVTDVVIHGTILKKKRVSENATYYHSLLAEFPFAQDGVADG